MKNRKYINRFLAILGCMVIFANNVMAYAEEIKPVFSESMEANAEELDGISDMDEKEESAEPEETKPDESADVEETPEGTKLDESADVEETPEGPEGTKLDESADVEETPEGPEETKPDESADVEETPAEPEETKPDESADVEETPEEPEETKPGESADESEREPKDWSADPLFSFTHVCLVPTENAEIYELNMDLEFHDFGDERTELVEGDQAVLELPERWFQIEDTVNDDGLPVFYSEKGEDGILSSEALAEYTVSDQFAEIVFNEHAEEIEDVSDIAGKLTLVVKIPRKALAETEQTVIWDIQSYSDGTVNQAALTLPARESKDWTAETEDFWAEVTEADGEEESVPELRFGFLRENPECPVLSGDTAVISLKDSGYEAEISDNALEVRGWIVNEKNGMTETERVIADYIYEAEEQKICLTFTEGIEDLENIASYCGIIALKYPLEIQEESLPELLTSMVQMFSEEEEEVIYWISPVTKHIYWQDNNDIGSRTNAEDYKHRFYEEGKLQYTYELDRELHTEKVAVKDILTEEQLNITDMSGTGHYVMEIPANILLGVHTWTDENGKEKTADITGWDFQPLDVDKYYFLDVPDEETRSRYSNSEVGLGWYYLKEFEYTLDVTLLRGDLHPIHGTTKAVLENFAFYYRRNGADVDFQSVTLQQMLDRSSSAVEITPEYDPGDNEVNVFHVSIKGIPQYRIDGTEREYFLKQVGDDSWSGQLKPVPEPGEPDIGDDYFTVTYVNTAASNHGTVTDRGYPGGNLILTLTGDTEYSGTKNWLDNGQAENRPAVEFSLWRYSRRDNVDYTQASPVKNAAGNVLSLSVPAGYEADSYSIDFSKKICPASVSDVLLAEDEKLPKYDSEGYEYIYFVKEITATGTEEYKKVFGEIDTKDGTDFSIEDTLPYEGERKKTDAGIYNGGTINNSLSGTVQTEFEKIWKAAAYQDEFREVRVEFTLQAKHRSPEHNLADDWYDVTDADGKVITQELTGFGEEKMSDSYSLYVRKYDSLGHELEYQWAETGIYQGENSTDNLLKTETADGETVRTFVLEQRGKQVGYRSESETQVQPDGTYQSVVVNRIFDTVDFDVEKLWIDGDGNPVTDTDKTPPVTLVLWRQTYDGNNEKIAEFPLDGGPDATVIPIGNEGAEITAQETKVWYAEFSNLPEFDKDGHKYDYFVLEKDGALNHARYEQGVTEDGDYWETITNVIGEGTVQYINVRKRWIDDGDLHHRGEVTLTLYNRTGKKQFKKIKDTVLNTDVFWWRQIPVDVKIDPANILILETQVAHTGDGGSVSITYTPDQMEQIWSEIHSGKDSSANIYYKTDEHWYQVNNSIKTLENAQFFTVTNWRLGSLGLDVTKTWLDGDGEAREKLKEELEQKGIKAYLKLTCDFPGAIDYVKGTVTVNGMAIPIEDKDRNPAGAYQEIDMTSGDPQTVYFYGLPKYDGKGGVVHYSIEEVYARKAGEGETAAYTETTLADEGIWTDFTVSYEIGKYTVGTTHTNDRQEFKVINRLIGEKNIVYRKQWLDAYRAERNERPDIYLNIYRQIHTSADETILEPIYQDHKWEKVGNEDQNYWSVSFPELPRYDDLGYEIIYYAQEKMHVNGGNFDYIPVYYKYDETGQSDVGKLQPFGDETGYYDGATEDDRLAVYNGTWLLKEGGTFVNQLEQNVTIEGKKIWGNFPGGYDMSVLPKIKFSVYQHLQSGNGTPDSGAERLIAYVTVEDWSAHYSDNTYKFVLEYTGENTNIINDDGQLSAIGGENASKLPLYDEIGRRYEYVVKEEIQLADGVSPELVYTSDVNHFMIQNFYQSVKGNLTVKKYLDVKLEEHETYPALTFVLTRFYEKKNADGTTTLLQDSSFQREGQIPYSDFEAGKGEGTYTFDNLEIYAPDGQTFRYKVTENSVDGYETAYALPGDRDKNGQILKDSQPNGTGLLPESSVGNLTASKDEDKIPDATFKNSETDDRIIIEGTKNWDDGGDALGFRPNIEMLNAGQTIRFEVTRYAMAQTGQENGIGTEEARLTVDDSKYEIVWSEGDKSDQYKFKITGKDRKELEKYAPNGMPWIYYVEEVLIAEEDGGTGLPGYVVPEKASPCTGTDESVTLGTGQDAYEVQKQETAVTNSLGKAGARIEKKWQTSKTPEKEAEKITNDNVNSIMGEDYLGYSMEVEFTLQAKLVEKYNQFGAAEVFTSNEDQSWVDTDEMFIKRFRLSKENYEKAFDKAKNMKPQSQYVKTDAATRKFVVCLKGSMLHDGNWKASFNYFPKYVRGAEGSGYTADGGYYELAYRFAESRIIYRKNGVNGEIIAEEVIGRPKEDGDIMKPDSSEDLLFETVGVYNPQRDPQRSTWVNILPVTELTVTKEWSDTGNAYGTRKTENGEWQVKFVIQRRDAEDPDAVWEEVNSYDKWGNETKKIITLKGTDDQASATVCVSNLPVYGIRRDSSDQTERVAYEYRARELNTDENETVIEAGGKHVYNGSGSGGIYNVTYADSQTPDNDGTTVYSTKARNAFDATQYYARKEWDGLPEECKDTWDYPVTLELKYQGTDDELHSFSKPAQVTLDGTADAGVTDDPDNLKVPYGEYAGADGKAWKAIWKGVPDYMPDSKTDNDGHTIYKVVELSGGFYQEESTENDAFVFRNTPTQMKISKNVDIGDTDYIDPDQWEFKFKLTNDKNVTGTYKAIVTGPDASGTGVSRTVTNVEIGKEFKLKNEETVTIYGLPIDNGTSLVNYTVEEVKDFALENGKFDAEFDVSVSVNGGEKTDGNTGTVTLPKEKPDDDAEVPSLAFRNTLEGAIHLVKKDEKGSLLKGVEFTVTYCTTEDGEYLSVDGTVCSNQELIDKKGVQKTDDKGEIHFTGLKLGYYYRIEETGPLPGTNGLVTPVITPLPKLLDSNAVSVSGTKPVGTVKADGETKNIYVELTYIVTNNSFTMPVTSGPGFFWPGMAGLALAGIGCGYWMISGRKKKRYGKEDE